MRLLFCLISVVFGVGLSSCRNTHAYEKYTKELDSLKVVLQQSVSHFKAVDSSACMKAYSKQYTYSLFINSHLKDTVTKTVAENLQAFQSVGKGMNEYLALRSGWLNEADLSVEQLQTLSHDLKTGSIDEEEAIEFINEEKKESEKIIEELNVNTEIIRKHLEVFNQALPVCEDLVKKLNSGVLPELIYPEITHQNSTN
ncbi:MAG: hypothetical protein H7141_10510 [Burkholderiales bacterium]|nr:hypothetical protein [Bacteroidia bacterium]